MRQSTTDSLFVMRVATCLAHLQRTGAT